MSSPSLAYADGLAVAATDLASHPDVATALGGTGRVASTPGPLYPCLVVRGDAGGSDRDIRWILDQVVVVEVWGDPDGTPGMAALKRVMYLVLEVLAALPERSVTRVSPVVSAVRSVTPATPAALDDQPRYIASVALTVHPPVLTPA